MLILVYKREKIKRGYEWMVIRIKHAESKAVKLGEKGKKDMTKGEHKREEMIDKKGYKSVTSSY